MTNPFKKTTSHREAASAMMKVPIWYRSRLLLFIFIGWLYCFLVGFGAAWFLIK